MMGEGEIFAQTSICNRPTCMCDNMRAIGGRKKAHLLGEAFRIVRQDGLQVLEIALVAHQHHHDRRVRMCAELLEPPLDVL